MVGSRSRAVSHSCGMRALRGGGASAPTHGRACGLRPRRVRTKTEERQGATRTCGTYCPTPLFPYSPQIPASRHSCLLPTWWFWRGGCTRSHSEHGRETPQRRWYFVSRRGRVGRCQVCQMHECKNLLDTKTRRIRRLKGPRKRPKSFQNNTNPGKSQRLR